MGTLITILILVVLIGLIIWKMIRDRKNGKKSCGCDCASSSACSACKDRLQK